MDVTSSALRAELSGWLGRARVGEDTCGHRGQTGDPLYASRRTLHTGADLLATKQKTRLLALFATDRHVRVEVTWTFYQDMIAAYRDPTGPPAAPR